jgi:probable F420-dependent oxidoreductase
MRFGLALFATDLSVRPDAAARLAEERGFDSLYLPEHTHIPVSRGTPHPLTGDVLDDSYRRTLDPWIGLAMAAAVTERIRLGTAVALVAEHDPITLAKEIATLDHLSGGRVTLGVGYGWNREEMADHGVDPRQRREVARDHVLLMKALWAEEVGGYEGRFARVAPSWTWPKPVHGRVPVLIGGAAGPKLFSAVAEWADGWMPNGSSGIRAALPALRDAWDAAGRDPAGPELAVVGVLPEPGRLEYLRGLGVAEVIFGWGWPDSESSARELDALAALVAPFR